MSVKQYDIVTNGISLHVTEQGEGPAVLFCHGFPDTSYTWRRQMQAITSAGYLSWETWKSTRWVTGYNTKPLPRSVTSS